MENREDVMIDIETLGTSFDSVMLSCSLVKFDIDTGEISDELTVYFDLQQSIDKGFKINAGTLQWWLTQNSDVFAKQFKDEMAHDSLYAIQRFINEDAKVWGNSASFDLGILGNYFKEYEIHQPWKFWNEMCVRTVCNINPSAKMNTEFVGEKHTRS